VRHWADWDLAFALFDVVGATPIEGEDGTTIALVNARDAWLDEKQFTIAATPEAELA
jgi:hypothetical protein